MPVFCFFFRRKYRGLQLRTVKRNRLRGQIAVVLSTVCPRSVVLIAGVFWTKSQSPRYSPGMGWGEGRDSSGGCIDLWKDL